MKQKMKINLIEVRNHVKIILLMLAICTLVMSFISGIFIFEKKINEKHTQKLKSTKVITYLKHQIHKSIWNLFRNSIILNTKS